jgi:DNA-directed RNA polymerase beta subunit
MDCARLTESRRNELTLLFHRVHGTNNHHDRSIRAFVLRGIANVLNELACVGCRDLLYYSFGNVYTRTARIREVDNTESEATPTACHTRQATFDVEVYGTICVQTRDEHGDLRPPVRADDLLLFTLPVPDRFNSNKYCIRGQYRLPVMRDSRQLNACYVYENGLAECRSQDHRERSSATLVIGIRGGRLCAILHVMGARIETFISVSLLMACYGVCGDATQLLAVAQGDAEVAESATALWGESAPDTEEAARAELTRIVGDEHRATRMRTSEILPQATLGRVLNTNSAHPLDCVYDSVAAEKARFLAYCVRRLLLVHVLHRQPYDNKDCIGTHTLETAGEMSLKSLRNVASSCLRQIQLGVQMEVRKKGPTSITPQYAWVIAATLNRTGYNVRYGYATGAMGSRKQGSKNCGRTVGDEVTPFAVISTLRTVRRAGFSADGAGSTLKPRLMPQDGSEWCVYGPADTPDGGQVGLTKHLALFTLARCASHAHAHIMLISDLLSGLPRGCEPVFFNGKECAHVESAADALTILRGSQPHILDPCLGCYYDTTDVRPCLKVRGDTGGIHRPLIADADDSPLSDEPLLPHSLWSLELLARRVVLREGADVRNPIAISLTDRDPAADYEFAELSMSAAESTIQLIGTRFAPHCAMPRTLYQCLMAKQALGGWRGEVAIGGDPSYSTMCAPGTTQFLAYPERPLCRPFTEVLDELAGTNCLTVNFAILATPTNQEDSMVLSQRYVDLGGGLGQMVQSYTEVNTGRSKHGCFCKPEAAERKYATEYKMDSDGLCAQGTQLRKNDMIIGQVRKGKKTQATDASTRHTVAGDSAVLDSCVTTTPEGVETVKTRTVTQLIPQTGDKFSFGLCGQKGTVGSIMPAEDMPFGFTVDPDDSDDEFEYLGVDCIANPMMCVPRRSVCETNVGGAGSRRGWRRAHML